jgi:streptomycin 6-kinase
VRLPEPLLARGAGDDSWARWLDRLPGTVRDLTGEWELVGDGEPGYGDRSLVWPVRAGDAPAVLKVGCPHPRSEHAHLALQHWHGDGAVRLLRADPRRNALLLERLSEEDLCDLWDVQACEVVAGLYGRLHVPAIPQLRRLSTVAGEWAGRFAALPRSAPVPHRLVDQARALAVAFSRDPATDGVLLHGNLHYRTVLAGEREPWLAVAPRPLNGDPHFEVAPLLHHAWDQVVASGDARAAVRRRFSTVVDTAGLDEDRARDWAVVREVAAAVDDLARPVPLRARITRSITVAKAVQD